MNALEEFDQPQQQQQVERVETKGMKRQRSVLSASTMTQTLLPASQSDDLVEDEQDQVLTVFSTNEKTILRTTIAKKSNRSSYLGQFYNVQGYTCETTFKITGKKPNGADILVRNGTQIWRDNLKRLVRYRRFVNGKLQGPDKIFCYPVKDLVVVGGSSTLVYLGRFTVFSRNFVDGVQQGKQIRNEFEAKSFPNDQRFFVFGKTRDEIDYVDGKKHGKQIRFRNSDSSIISLVEYENGVKHGKAETFYSGDKKCQSSWLYINGARNSGCSVFRNSTAIKEQLIVAGGLSTLTKFDKNQTLTHLTTRNLQGQKEGEQRYPRKNGQIVTDLWKNGCRIEQNGKKILVTSRATKRNKGESKDDPISIEN